MLIRGANRIVEKIIMAYLMPEFEGGGGGDNGTAYFRNEILRLQELCADNFGKIDALKKENKKLQDLHTELKETTSDLAYSLAECPWWEKESLQAAVKILASFAQKIQYILELPTFIDPVEQLNRNLGLGAAADSPSKVLKTSRDISPGGKYTKVCTKCNKKFVKIENYKRHKGLHPDRPRKLKCKVCSNKLFSSFGSLRMHLNTVHAFNPTSKTTEETYSSLREILQRNHVRVWRFFKCQYCETACSSMGALKKHFLTCRSKGPVTQKPDEITKKDRKSNEEETENPKPKSNSKPAVQHLGPDDTSDDEKETRKDENAQGKKDADESKTPEQLTVAEAPVRLAAMHSISISSTPTPKPGEAVVDDDEISPDLPAYYLSSSSSSLDSEVETSLIRESETGTILMKYICSHHQCCKSFSTRAKLAHHRKCHRKRREELLSCQVCGKEFHDKYRLKTHWLSHCPRGFAPKPIYRCLECGKIHRNLNDLADHSQKAHIVSKLPKPLYSCGSCGFRTNFRRKFDVHLKQKCKNRHNFGLSISPRPNNIPFPGPSSLLLQGMAFRNAQQPSTSLAKN